MLLAAAAAACREHRAPGGPIVISIGPPGEQGDQTRRLVVRGIDDDNLRALRGSRWSDEQWRALLRVTVTGSDSVPIEGRYSATDSLLEFRPAFAFDAGRSYTARFDPGKLPTPSPDSVVLALLDIKRPNGVAPTRIVRILPTADRLPENLLRVYIEFSAPMSREPGTAFVHLINDSGHEVQSAFLPLDADFWNPAHTRYTVFFDPGRVKRGIRPNEQMGRALQDGRAYAIVVDSAWRDALGTPLAGSFRREFYAGRAITTPIPSDSTWTIQAPAAGSRDPLVIQFPRPLDHGLLRRALGVETKNGKAVPGDVEITDHETGWRMTPRVPWSAGEYRLVVLSILEDPQGNRIGRPFEVDEFDRVDSTATPERFTRPFTIR